MRVMAKAEMRPAAADAPRNPIACVVMTAALAATFWIGMIWLAGRLV